MALNFSDSLIRIINFVSAENETITIPVELKEKEAILGLSWNETNQVLFGKDC